MPQENWNATGVSDDNNAYVLEKDWKNNDEMITSIRELESKLGGSITMPNAEAPTKEFDAFYTKIGRPTTSDEYSYKMVDGGDKDQYEWYKKTAHKIGLSDGQAVALGEAWDTWGTERAKLAVDSSTAQMQAIKDKYGDEYDTKIAAGQAVVKGLGLSEDDLIDIENKLDTKGFVNLFVSIGEKIGEGGFNSNPANPGASTPLTKEQALLKVDAFNSDEKLQKLYKANDKATIQYRRSIYDRAFN